MQLSKRVCVALLFTATLLTNTLYAVNHEQLPSYDIIPITPETWQQVELSYSDIINGVEYPAEIKLLRPIKWLKENGMDKVGNEVALSIPEFGIENVAAKVTAIKQATLNTSKMDLSAMDSRPVVGTFKRYAEDVRTYKFKDEQGNVEEITATPDHHFYLKNKDEFIKIDEVLSSDELVNQFGQEVKLVCPVGKKSSCGEQYNKDGKPVVVYNLEIYREHVYYVGGGVLVHNGGCDIGIDVTNIDDLAEDSLRYTNERISRSISRKSLTSIIDEKSLEVVEYRNIERQLDSSISIQDRINKSGDLSYGNCDTMSLFCAQYLANLSDFNISIGNYRGYTFVRVMDKEKSLIIDPLLSKVYSANNLNGNLFGYMRTYINPLKQPNLWKGSLVPFTSGTEADIRYIPFTNFQ